MTGVVALVIVVAKFSHGAYLVLIAIPLIVGFCLLVNRHYRRVSLLLAPAGAQ